MNDYAPESSLGWLDFDSAASERVSTLLRSLDDPATLDVLGLGTVRDAFSDMLTQAPRPSRPDCATSSSCHGYSNT